MSLRANTANGGAGKQPSTAFSQGSTFLEYLQLRSLLTHTPGEEKQKRLLASDAGHFSMIKYPLLQRTTPMDALTPCTQGSSPRRPDH
jgi:hypothetical protein